MEQNLCHFCQTVPFREKEYSGTDGNFYRAQEIDGNIRLFQKLGLTEEWVPANHDRIDLDVGYQRTDTVPQLHSITASAEAGCDFCNLMLASDFKNRCIEAWEERPDVSTVSIQLYYRVLIIRGEFGLTKLQLKADFGGGAVFDVGRTSSWASYEVIAEEHDPCFELLGIFTRSPPTIPYDGRLPIISQWITNCDCRPETSNGDVPTRLLDVGSEDEIHLIDCRGRNNLSEWRYVALSHCWGSPNQPPLKTTMDSLEERCRNIPLEHLPKNYQDAATVTRSLGVRYLWVDSLCIIQDSITDWEQESTRMHDVYRNAYLTIVAANGNSCHAGFLDFSPEPRVRLHYKSSTSPSSKGTYLLQRWRDFEEEISQSQWNKRGWTFQEEKCAERKLFFTTNDAGYWCPKGIITTIQPQKIPRRGPPSRANVFDIVHGLIMQKVNQTDIQFFCSFRDCWSDIINYYSGREFTNPKDRLPALSALAKLFSASTGGKYEYVSGLWTQNLYLWLLWECDCPQNYNLNDRLRHARGSDFIALSWSWASQSQVVIFEYPLGTGSYRCAAHTMEPVVEVDGSNPYGRVKYGSLRVLGAVREIPSIFVKRYMHFGWSGNEDLDLKLSFDWREPDLDMMEEGQQISCPAITNLSMLLLAKYVDLEAGLLLHSSGEDGVYFRVGIFRSSSIRRENTLFDGCEIRTVKII